VRAAITPLLARVSTLPHVAGIISPYSPAGHVQVSHERTIAFATIDYDKRANLLPASAGKVLLDQVRAVHVPGLRITAGGQAIENAEGFSIGLATSVGVIAALVILLITFGSPCCSPSRHR
jgi:putative drug exporter of the RND superfamily